MLTIQNKFNFIQAPFAGSVGNKKWVNFYDTISHYLNTKKNNSTNATIAQK